MNASLIAALHSEIETVPRAELPSILGVLKTLEAEALMRITAPEEACAHADAFERIEAALSEIRAAADKDEFLTEEECAALRHKGVSALRKERARRAGPPSIKDGGRVLYSKRAVMEWLATKQHETKDSERAARFPRAVIS